MTINQKLANNRYKQQRRKDIKQGVFIAIIFIILCLANAYTTYI